MWSNSLCALCYNTDLTNQMSEPPEKKAIWGARGGGVGRSSCIAAQSNVLCRTKPKILCSAGVLFPGFLIVTGHAYATCPYQGEYPRSYRMTPPPLEPSILAHYLEPAMPTKMVQWSHAAVSAKRACRRRVRLSPFLLHCDV